MARIRNKVWTKLTPTSDPILQRLVPETADILKIAQTGSTSGEDVLRIVPYGSAVETQSLLKVIADLADNDYNVNNEIIATNEIISEGVFDIPKSILSEDEETELQGYLDDISGGGTLDETETERYNYLLRLKYGYKFEFLMDTTSGTVPRITVGLGKFKVNEEEEHSGVYFIDEVSKFLNHTVVDDYMEVTTISNPPPADGFIGDTHIDSNIIDSIPDTSLLMVGWTLIGDNIPALSIITEITSSTSITINTNCTADEADVNVSVGKTYYRRDIVHAVFRDEGEDVPYLEYTYGEESLDPGQAHSVADRELTSTYGSFPLYSILYKRTHYNGYIPTSTEYIRHDQIFDWVGLRALLELQNMLMHEKDVNGETVYVVRHWKDIPLRDYTGLLLDPSYGEGTIEEEITWEYPAWAPYSHVGNDPTRIGAVQDVPINFEDLYTAAPQNFPFILDQRYSAIVDYEDVEFHSFSVACSQFSEGSYGVEGLELHLYTAKQWCTTEKVRKFSIINYNDIDIGDIYEPASQIPYYNSNTATWLADYDRMQLDDYSIDDLTHLYDSENSIETTTTKPAAGDFILIYEGKGKYQISEIMATYHANDGGLGDNNIIITRAFKSALGSTSVVSMFSSATEELVGNEITNEFGVESTWFSALSASEKAEYNAAYSDWYNDPPTSGGGRAHKGGRHTGILALPWESGDGRPDLVTTYTDGAIANVLTNYRQLDFPAKVNLTYNKWYFIKAQLFQKGGTYDGYPGNRMKVIYPAIENPAIDSWSELNGWYETSYLKNIGKYKDEQFDKRIIKFSDDYGDIEDVHTARHFLDRPTFWKLISKNLDDAYLQIPPAAINDAGTAYVDVTRGKIVFYPGEAPVNLKITCEIDNVLHGESDTENLLHIVNSTEIVTLSSYLARMQADIEELQANLLASKVMQYRGINSKINKIAAQEFSLLEPTLPDTLPGLGTTIYGCYSTAVPLEFEIMEQRYPYSRLWWDPENTMAWEYAKAINYIDVDDVLQEPTVNVFGLVDHYDPMFNDIDVAVANADSSINELELTKRISYLISPPSHLTTIDVKRIGLRLNDRQANEEIDLGISGDTHEWGEDEHDTNDDGLYLIVHDNSNTCYVPAINANSVHWAYPGYAEIKLSSGEITEDADIQLSALAPGNATASLLINIDEIGMHTFTGKVTSGSPVITNITVTSGGMADLLVGMVVKGANIPLDSKIQSKTSSPATITLNHNATGGDGITLLTHYAFPMTTVTFELSPGAHWSALMSALQTQIGITGVKCFLQNGRVRIRNQKDYTGAVSRIIIGDDVETITFAGSTDVDGIGDEKKKITGITDTDIDKLKVGYLIKTGTGLTANSRIQEVHDEAPGDDSWVLLDKDVTADGTDVSFTTQGGFISNNNIGGAGDIELLTDVKASGTGSTQYALKVPKQRVKDIYEAFNRMSSDLDTPGWQDILLDDSTSRIADGVLVGSCSYFIEINGDVYEIVIGTGKSYAGTDEMDPANGGIAGAINDALGTDLVCHWREFGLQRRIRIQTTASGTGNTVAITDNPERGFQEILRGTVFASGDILTNGDYNLKVSIDGGGNIDLSFTATGGTSTLGNLITYYNGVGQLDGAAVIAIVNGKLRITSAEEGAASIIAITEEDDDLIEKLSGTLSGYNPHGNRMLVYKLIDVQDPALAAAVPGANGTLESEYAQDRMWVYFELAGADGKMSLPVGAYHIHAFVKYIDSQTTYPKLMSYDQARWLWLEQGGTGDAPDPKPMEVIKTYYRPLAYTGGGTYTGRYNIAQDVPTIIDAHEELVIPTSDGRDGDEMLWEGTYDPTDPEYNITPDVGHFDLMPADLSSQNAWDIWEYLNYVGIDLRTGRIKLPATINWPIITVTGDPQDNTYYVTDVSSTAALCVGMTISGTGIPADTRIAEIIGPEMLKLDKEVTATGNDITLSCHHDFDTEALYAEFNMRWPFSALYTKSFSDIDDKDVSNYERRFPYLKVRDQVLTVLDDDWNIARIKARAINVEWESNLQYEVGDIVTDGRRTYRCINQHTSVGTDSFIDDIADWAVIGTSGGTMYDVEVSPNTHDFIVGDLVRFQKTSDGDPTIGWCRAQASSSTKRALAMVYSVQDDSNFTIISQGHIDTITDVLDDQGDPLDPHTWYYLSDTVAGGLRKASTTPGVLPTIPQKVIYTFNNAPTTPSEAMVFVDLDTSGMGAMEVEEFTNRTGTTITLSYSPISNKYMNVFKNGQRLPYGSGTGKWTISDKTLTFGDALIISDIIIASYVYIIWSQPGAAVATSIQTSLADDQVEFDFSDEITFDPIGKSYCLVTIGSVLQADDVYDLSSGDPGPIITFGSPVLTGTKVMLKVFHNLNINIPPGNIDIGLKSLTLSDTGNELYLGSSDTDGSWRIVKPGNDLLFQRREAGLWVTKGTFSA